jgi:hypothetical protein
LDGSRARRQVRAISPTRKRERRIGPRTAVSRRGTLLDGTTALGCLVEDFSPGGFSISSDREFFVGQVLELKCELYPNRLLMCEIEISDIRDTSCGTCIVRIERDAAELLEQFLYDFIRTH